MHEKKQRRRESDMLVLYTDGKQSERPALAATEISVSSSSSESQVPQILPVTSSIIHLGEFDFIAPPSLPDATQGTVKKHILHGVPVTDRNIYFFDN